MSATLLETFGSETLSTCMQEQLNRLPSGDSRHAQDLKQVVCAALERGDSKLLLEIVDTSDGLRPTVATQALWLPIIVGCSTAIDCGLTFPNHAEILRLIRLKIRETMERLPLLPNPLWIIPGENSQTTAAHVAAIMLNLRGKGGRVWSFSNNPPGPSLTISSAQSLIDLAVRGTPAKALFQVA